MSSLPRVIAIAVVLPLAIATVDYMLLGGPSTYGGRAGPRQIGFGSFIQFTWYVVQIGIVGYVVGRGIDAPLLRWIVFAWILVLVNLLSAVLAMNATPAYGHAPAHLPPAALFAGQLGLCVVWAFMGDTPWTARLPATATVILAILVFWYSLASGGWGRLWTDLLLLQVITLAILCGLLRIAGFKLRQLQTGSAGSEPDRGALQFGLKHVLMWSTVLCVILGIAKSFDVLNLRMAGQLFGYIATWKVIVATCSGICIIVALWVALGRGHSLIRYSLGLMLFLLVGVGLSTWSLYNAAALQIATAPFAWDPARWETISSYELGWWWLGWLFLSAGLLAATLIILRTRNYRLLRIRGTTA